MTNAPAPPPDDLGQALKDMILRPVQTLVPPWSWKAAAFSAVLRSATFFAANLRAGRKQAVEAMLIEAAFATVAAGLIGAISQQLRRANPLWATIGVVWLGMPALMVLAQFGLHRAVHTPHLTGGLVFSFCFTALASAFSWYAMRHGAMLGGIDQTTIRHDVHSLPAIAADFLMAAPRAIKALIRPAQTAAEPREP